MASQTTGPILVTGASSGIGYHLTQYLAKKGHQVYATARKEGDLANLGKIEGVSPLSLDVTDPQQIQEALEAVNQAGKGLYGLVNNAGIGELGMLAAWSDEALFDIFNVNLFGVHRMVKAFVALLIEAQGRIVNIGSQGGMLTQKYMGPYTMTKHALEAYSATLAEELQSYQVHVSIVQPGGIVSAIGNNAMPATMTRFEQAPALFQAEAQAVITQFKQPNSAHPDEPESETNRKPSSPQIVSEAVYDALFALNPKLHYLVGTTWEGNRVINGLLKKLLAENDNPQHNYSRDELVALLDEHIAQKKSGS